MESCIKSVDNIQIENSIFDDVCDWTYVILCCYDTYEREKNVFEQLELLRPTRNISLVYNKGYRHCYTEKVSEDLFEISKYIYKDMIDKNYNRVLILEDDFLLKKPIPVEDVQSIVNFIEEVDPELYSLGSHSFFNPSYIFRKHVKLIGYMATSHAYMINQELCKKVLNLNQRGRSPSEDIVNYDYHIDNILSISNEKYKYYKPLVYQLFPATENQKNWGGKGKFSKLLNKIVVSLQIYFLKIDRQLEPGWTILYIIPYIQWIFLLLAIPVLGMALWRRGCRTSYRR
jgi:hypothetical protein